MHTRATHLRQALRAFRFQEEEKGAAPPAGMMVLRCYIAGKIQFAVFSRAARLFAGAKRKEGSATTLSLSLSLSPGR